MAYRLFQTEHSPAWLYHTHPKAVSSIIPSFLGCSGPIATRLIELSVKVKYLREGEGVEIWKKEPKKLTQQLEEVSLPLPSKFMVPQSRTCQAGMVFSL